MMTGRIGIALLMVMVALVLTLGIASASEIPGVEWGTDITQVENIVATHKVAGGLLAESTLDYTYFGGFRVDNVTYHFTGFGDYLWKVTMQTIQLDRVRNYLYGKYGNPVEVYTDENGVETHRWVTENTTVLWKGANLHFIHNPS